MEAGELPPARIEVTDEYLLQEWIDCFAKVCTTFPFLKSKTSQFISSAFVESKIVKQVTDTLQL
jgi:hypothetical protein